MSLSSINRKMQGVVSRNISGTIKSLSTYLNRFNSNINKTLTPNKNINTTAFVQITKINKQQVDTVENVLSQQNDLVEKTNFDISADI